MSRPLTVVTVDDLGENDLTFSATNDIFLGINDANGREKLLLGFSPDPTRVLPGEYVRRRNRGQQCSTHHPGCYQKSVVPLDEGMEYN